MKYFAIQQNNSGNGTYILLSVGGEVLGSAESEASDAESERGRTVDFNETRVATASSGRSRLVDPGVASGLPSARLDIVTSSSVAGGFPTSEA